MKPLFTIFILCISGLLFAQDPLAGKIAGIQLTQAKHNLNTDTVPTVVYLTQKLPASNPLYLINGEVVPEQVLQTIDPDKIASIEVDTEQVAHNGLPHQGRIRILLQDGYEPLFISLQALREKYALPRDLPTLFLLDNEPIHTHYDQFLVDEKYLLKIEIDTIDHPQEGLSVQVVQLFTRSKENLQRANTIIIRGQEESL